eukprot:GEMP01022540.1.p1 GENE.GEMP01022540.1~~GEMP01022540.1.p1  ORF type:complete len:206 (-),score=33.78 GEMP01022540.1:1330-1947(-)
MCAPGSSIMPASAKGPLPTTSAAGALAAASHHADSPILLCRQSDDPYTRPSLLSPASEPDPQSETRLVLRPRKVLRTRGSPKPPKPRPQTHRTARRRRCNVRNCNTIGRNKVYHYDTYGEPGVRCMTHGGGVHCVVRGCASFAVGRKRPYVDEFGPPGHRCLRHNGGRRCTVPHCDNLARSSRVEKEDLLGPTGVRCNAHSSIVR